MILDTMVCTTNDGGNALFSVLRLSSLPVFLACCVLLCRLFRVPSRLCRTCTRETYVRYPCVARSSPCALIIPDTPLRTVRTVPVQYVPVVPVPVYSTGRLPLLTFTRLGFSFSAFHDSSSIISLRNSRHFKTTTFLSIHFS